MRSIKLKLLAVFLPVLFFSLSILFAISYYSSQKALTASVDETGQALGNGYAVEVRNSINEIQIKLEALAGDPRLHSRDNTMMFAALAEAKKRISNVDVVNFHPLNGQTLRSDGKMLMLGERDYMAKVISSKQAFVSEPLINKMSGKLAINISVPVLENGQVIGVLTCPSTFDNIAAIIKDIKFKNSGYAFLADDQGMVIADPSKPDIVGKLNLLEPKVGADLNLSIAELDKAFIGAFKQAAATGQQVKSTHKDINNILMTTVFTPVDLAGGNRWILMVTAPETEVMQDVRALAKTMMLAAIACLLAAALVVLLFSQRFVAPIVRIKEQAALLAQGDLQERELGGNSKDEIGQLADSFRIMTRNLRGLITAIQGNAQQIAAASEQLSASADETQLVVNRVAEQMTGLAEDSEQQMQAAVELSQTVEEMSAGIDQMARKAKSAAEGSGTTAISARQGCEAVDMTIQQMEKIEKTVNYSATIVGRLGERSKQIGQIIDTIANIAGQTNLLALNAAIEAARAGEAGRGFAVVAEEVRKLAEQSSTAAEQITAIISEIQQDTDKAVAAIEDGTAEVTRGTDVVGTAGKTFQAIVEMVNEVSAQIEDISAATGQIANNSHQLVTTAQNIDKATQNNSEYAQSVSAASEEQAATMEQIAASSQNLAKLAQDLQSAIGNFRL